MNYFYECMPYKYSVSFPGRGSWWKSYLMSFCLLLFSLPPHLVGSLCFSVSLGLWGESGFHGNGTLCLRRDVSLHHKLLMALICMCGCACVCACICPPQNHPHSISKRLRKTHARARTSYRCLRAIMRLIGQVWTVTPRQSDASNSCVKQSYVNKLFYLYYAFMLSFLFV